MVNGTAPVKPGKARTLTQDPSKLRRRRLEAGLTGAQLGKLAGVSKTTISLLECRHQSARPGLMAALAAALGCQIVDIMPDRDSAATRALAQAPAEEVPAA
jgi:transcriptional regulator with XRE-family HTH domain